MKSRSNNGRFIDLTGKRFGRLTVTGLNPEEIKTPSRSYLLWDCVCDCGTIRVAKGKHLVDGRCESCGCLRTESIGRVSKHPRLRPYEALYKSLIRVNAYRACEMLTYEDFLDFTKISACSYCEKPVTWAEYSIGRNGSQYNLDRYDNEKGYTKDNLVVCCHKCNRGKSDIFTGDQWKALVRFMQNNTDLFPKE